MFYCCRFTKRKVKIHSHFEPCLNLIEVADTVRRCDHPLLANQRAGTYLFFALIDYVEESVPRKGACFGQGPSSNLQSDWLHKISCV